jgi:hypothetical protein
MRVLSISILASVTTLVALGSLGLACGGGGSGGSGASTSKDASSEVTTQPSPEAGGDASDGGAAEAAVEAGYPALVPTDVPQVQSRGGSVMAAPKVVPIFYASDDPATTAQLQDYVNKLGATQYWSVMQEYGVGAITGEPGIQLTPADDPPLIYDDADIRTWLANKLNANDPAFPQPDANTIYAFFFPAGVTITQGGVSGGYPGDGGVYPEGGTDASVPATAAQSCIAGGFGGYHGVDQAVNSGQAVYAVIARCANIFGLGGVDATTGIASHELGEASSDPVSAYGHLDAAHSYWRNLIGGSEIGDMCAQQVGSFVKFSDSPYVVQRLWSNKAALAGTDPCVPEPTGEVYFNTIPNLPDTLQLSGRGADGGTTTIPTKAVQIAVGSSKSIDLDLFSTAPTSAPWKIVAQDEYQLGFAATKQLTLAPSITVGENGTKINLSITVNSAGSKNQEPFLVTSTAQDGTQHMWAGLVSQ